MTAFLLNCVSCAAQPAPTASPAPAGFDNQTNGFEPQAAFDDDLKNFESVESVKDGLGPVYNSTSCVSCHQNPVTGGPSQVAVLRAGHYDRLKRQFVEPPGGSLIFQRAIDASIQAGVSPGNEIRTLRMATNVLGNGFIECIADDDIRKVQLAQPKGMRGAIVLVPVAVAPAAGGGFTFGERVGRFGWKCQDASLLNFSAGAYINEMGITSPLQPKENSSVGRDVTPFDTVADPEDQAAADHPFGKDVEAFTRFMRSTKAPPTDPKPLDPAAVERGKALFMNNERTGCAICHVPDWTTMAAGTTVADFSVPDALGNKVIRPFTDLMLHDVNTGDGIVQTQHAQRPPRGCENTKYAKIEEGPNVHRALNDMFQYHEDDAAKGDNRSKRRVFKSSLVSTAHMIRTAPLWGLRTRPQLMHDGLSLTVDEAIRRHGNQAHESKHNYVYDLTEAERNDLLIFLGSL